MIYFLFYNIVINSVLINADVHYHFKQVNHIVGIYLPFFNQSSIVGYLHGLRFFVIINAVVIKIFVNESLCSGLLRKKLSVFSVARDLRLDMKDVLGRRLREDRGIESGAHEQITGATMHS